MNTVKKGDKFENICFDLVKKEIENHSLGYIPNFCKVFKKKGYYSKLREKNIIFDIVVEVWLPNSKHYSHLCVIECKNYSTKKVPIDDIEEFYMKVDQVAGLNRKGIIITSSTFGKGAYTFAKNRGIMLIEVNSNLTWNIILHKTTRYEQRKFEQNLNEIIKIDESTYLGSRTIKKVLHGRWNRVLSAKIIKSVIGYVKEEIPKEDIKIPYLSKEEIKEVAEELLKRFDDSILVGERSLNWEKFREFLLEVFGLSFTIENTLGYDSKNREILSACYFIDKRISILRKLVETKRENFVIAHEIGHFLLHNKLVLSQNQYEGFSNILGNLEMNQQRDYLEWQANHFASNLVMPEKPFLVRYGLELEKNNRNPIKPLYVDDQRCNQKDFNQITGNLAIFFKTSKTSVIYRLSSLEKIKFGYRTKSFENIVKTNMLK